MVQNFSDNVSARQSVRHFADNVPYGKPYERLPNNDKLKISTLFRDKSSKVAIYNDLDHNRIMFAGKISLFMVLLAVFTFLNLSQFKLSGFHLLLYVGLTGVGSLTISQLTFQFIKYVVFKNKSQSQENNTPILYNYFVNYLNEVIEFEDKRLIRRYRFIDVSRSTSDFLYFSYDYPSEVKKIHYKKPKDLSTSELAIVNACPDECLSVGTLSDHVTGIIDTIKVLEEEERQKDYQKTYNTYLKANQTHVETRDISSLQEVEHKLQNIIHDHQQNIKKRSDING